MLKNAGIVEFEVNILCDLIGQFELLVVKFQYIIDYAYPHVNMGVELKDEGVSIVTEVAPQTMFIVIY